MYLVVEKILDMENRITEYTIKALNALIGIECFYERRLDIKAVSEILGHANVNITLNRYVHPDMDTKRNILNSIYSKHSESDEPQILRGQL